MYSLAKSTERGSETVTPKEQWIFCRDKTLASKYHSPKRETRLLWKMSGSRAGEGRVKMKLEHLLATEGKEMH